MFKRKKSEPEVEPAPPAEVELEAEAPPMKKGHHKHDEALVLPPPEPTLSRCEVDGFETPPGLCPVCGNEVK